MTAAGSRVGGTGGKDLVLALVAVVVVALGLVVGIGALFADEGEIAPPAVEVEFGQVERDAFDDVPLGVDEEALEQALLPARPLGPDVVQLYEVRVPDAAAESCLYYEAADGLARDLYRFCFERDQLVDKEYVE